MFVNLKDQIINLDNIITITKKDKHMDDELPYSIEFTSNNGDRPEWNFRHESHRDNAFDKILEKAKNADFVDSI